MGHEVIDMSMPFTRVVTVTTGTTAIGNWALGSGLGWRSELGVGVDVGVGAGSRSWVSVLVFGVGVVVVVVHVGVCINNTNKIYHRCRCYVA